MKFWWNKIWRKFLEKEMESWEKNWKMKKSMENWENFFRESKGDLVSYERLKRERRQRRVELRAREEERLFVFFSRYLALEKRRKERFICFLSLPWNCLCRGERGTHRDAFMVWLPVRRKREVSREYGGNLRVDFCWFKCGSLFKKRRQGKLGVGATRSSLFSIFMLAFSP